MPTSLDHPTLPGTRRHRAGNAMVVALGFLLLCAALMVSSASSATQILTATSRRTPQLRALGAAEAVLQRREAAVAEMAQNGALLTWTGDFASERANFGEDTFDGAQVRWKIEPARTIRSEDLGGAADPTHLWVSNPSPDTFYQPLSLGEQPNEHSYLYRVAAQASILGADGQAQGVAQGVRYVSINEEPLFRYVIFYAKNGPKGDLELSHGPGVNIRGGVYSNGAIYLGASTSTNHWDVRNPALGGPTVIGPDSNARDVPVIGVDGIFRLAKPLLYGAFNSYPMGGTNPGFSAGSDFSLVAGLPGDPAGTSLASVTAATNGGRFINPYRIQNESLTTIGPARTINGVPIVGRTGAGALGNDSRDNQRPVGQEWRDTSLGSAPLGFSGMARSRVTNARVKNLPQILRDRPFEAQKVVYAEGSATDDPDDDIDEHIEARPLFIDVGGSETPTLAAAFTPTGLGPMEAPGQYLKYAFGGGDAAFCRKTDMTGWETRTRSGGPVANVALQYGLIIRERPVPETGYLVAPAESLPASISNRNYLPYAYGKHLRPSIWPFTECWIGDRGQDSSSGLDRYFANTMVAFNSGTVNGAAAAQWYDYGGTVTVIEGSDSGASAGDESPADDGYHRSNMRLIHLMNAGTTRAGTTLTGATNSSAFYFPKANFSSLQVRIQDISGGQLTWDDNRGRKVGIMLASVNAAGPEAGAAVNLLDTGTSPRAFNSRQAFAAMLWSPERGFFAQHRRTPSILTPVNVFYSGNPNQPEGLYTNNYGGTTTADHVRIALEASNFTGTTSTSIDYQTGTTTGPTSQNVDTGEGNFSLRRGPYTRQFRRNARTNRNGVYFQITTAAYAHMGAFLSLDTGRICRLFATNAATTATWTSPNTVTSGTSTTTSAAGSTYTYGSWNYVVYVDADSIRFNRTSYTRVHGAYTTYSEGKNARTGATVTIGASTILRSVNGTLQGSYSSARNAYNASNGTSGENPYILALESMGWTVVNWNDSDWSSLPALPAYPAAPAVPVSPMSPNPMLKFTVERSSYANINSWLSARGSWFATAVQKWLPNNGLGAMTPLTNSFEPDQWTGTAAPTSTSLATGTEGSIVPGTTGGPVATAAWEDVQPVGWTATMPGPSDYPWVRIERVGVTNTVQFKYYFGSLTPPADNVASAAWPNWQLLRNPATVTPFNTVTAADAAVTEDISGWTANLLVGLVSQSGADTSVAQTSFDKITLTQTTGVTGLRPDGTISWETTGTPNDLTRYLCSQYQVFWGPFEITEDFFLFGESLPTTRLAQERWLYNTREFWSQSRWWNEGEGARSGWIEKETGTTPPVAAATNVVNHTQRRLFARSTVLDLDMANLQTYIRTRSVANATTERIAGGATMPGLTWPDLLSTTFGGLFYASRTNRYPWNPTPGSPNPWNPSLPNTSDNYADLTMPTLTYALAVNRPPLSPPCKSVDFHHGVMISNGAAINWGLDGSGNQPFGTGKSSIVTSGQLFVRGDFNSLAQAVDFQGTANTAKVVPVAVMADQVTLLSNAWDPLAYQVDSLVVTTNGVTAGQFGILGLPGGAPATTTTYNTCLVTNNQPTTQSRVFEGQGAPFINTMLYLEDWSGPGATMNYLGSLVVLDTSRYTRDFLLQEVKEAGRTPFGTIGWPALVTWGGTGTFDWCLSAGTNGSLPVYTPPVRNMTFNDDLLTEEGTPPNTPFGLTATGVGGWTRIVR